MMKEKLETELYEILEPYLIDNAQSSIPLAEDIKKWHNKQNSLNKVKEFMIATEQPIHNHPTNENKQRAVLRLSLILEELTELAEALGEVKAYKDLLREIFVKIAKGDIVNNNDPIEALDALCDLRYVVDGAGYEFGLVTNFDAAFNEVHESNMSKFSNTDEEALATFNSYRDKGIECYNKKVGNIIVTYRIPDNKVLKSVNFKEPNLEQFINQFNL